MGIRGGSIGDPQGILGGSKSETGDPGVLYHIKIGGSSARSVPLYNIKGREHRKKRLVYQPAGCADLEFYCAFIKIVLELYCALKNVPKSKWKQATYLTESVR